MQKTQPVLSRQSIGDSMSKDLNLKLIEKAKAGDQDAFEQLWSQHQNKANAVVCSRLQYSSDAVPEVMQQVRFNALRAIGQFNGHDRFSMWLCKLADRTASSYSCTENTEGEDVVGPGSSTVSAHLDDGKTAAMLAMADKTMETMGIRQQKILQLVCREKCSPTEVAGSLGIKRQDVYDAVKTFRRKLQDSMKEPK